MIDPIINFETWLNTPLGECLLRWEQEHTDRAVEDIFGYNALQLGLPTLTTLANSRIPNRWRALEQPLEPNRVILPDLVTRFDALPFPEQSIDLVVLPHTLNLVADPHTTLREVQRILVPEGKAIITCLNPASLWGLHQRRVYFLRRLGTQCTFLPLGAGSLIGYWRLRDWLRLLGLEVIAGRFGCYRPSFKTQKWLDRTSWMEPAGDRWWPILGAAFQITVVKRIKGMRLIGPQWKKTAEKIPSSAVTVPQNVSSQTKIHPSHLIDPGQHRKQHN